MIKTNLKKKIVSIVLVMLMVMTMAACGSETSTTSNEATIDENASTGSDTVASIENAGSNETQDVVAVEETSEVEETKEYTYEEKNNCFLIPSSEFVYEGEYFMDYQSTDPQDNEIKFVDVEGWPEYAIYDSINLYAGTGQVKGYTKENAICQLCATSEEGWGVIIIDGKTIYIRMEDFEGNSVSVKWDADKEEYIIPERGNTTTSSDATSTSSNTTSNEGTTSKDTNTTSNATTSETSTNTSNVAITTNEVETSSTTSNASNDKYTPDEAVAIYRSILESNGMTWDPSLPNDGASWGTGWIELKKGKPEEAAQMDLEGYAYGDGGGRSKTRYYIEVTSYDDNRIYITGWSAS
jgi:hypothetical protein